MNGSKYVDVASINQVIGCIYNDIKLLEQSDRYTFTEDDFPSSLHKIIFGSIYNLYNQGIEKMSIEVIEDYLESRPKRKAEYKAAKGAEYLMKCSENADAATLNYHYQRMKKFTLLRAFEDIGLDMKDYYDPNNIFDNKLAQKQNDWLDNTPLAEIVSIIEDKITQIKMEVVDNTEDGVEDVSEGIDEFLASLKDSPDIGYPLYSDLMNTVTRGARLGKFYLRSAATNVGKSRAMIADACCIGVSERYSLEMNTWISVGEPQATLFISVEQNRNEIQSMCLAFIAGVDESHILDQEFFEGEEERIAKAVEIIKQGKIKFVSMPNFSLIDVENIIKRGIRKDGCRYIFFDYLSTSMKILEEITRRSGGTRLREDQILYLMSVRLRDICSAYNVFIMSSTQLNASYQESETPDQNLLRGRP